MKLIDAGALKQDISDHITLNRADVLELIDAQPTIDIKVFKQMSLFEIENSDPVQCRNVLRQFLEYIFYAQPMK